MGIFSFNKNAPITQSEVYTPSIFKSITANLMEKFKGEVEQKEVKFPKDLGEAHPFDFKELEQLYKKFGFFTAVVDKYIDFVVGPGFFVECDDERAKKIIEDFMQDVNFDSLLRAWTKEALVKGNGFMEIGGKKNDGVKGLKLLNANYMYVKRDNKGVVKSFNQYTGAFQGFDQTKVIPFDTKNIAHVSYNLVGDCAYGLGIGYPAIKFVDNFLRSQKDLHMIMDKKANAPLHFKIGKVDGDIKILPKQQDIDAAGQKIEIMTNKSEFVTDALTDIKAIDYGNIGEKMVTVLENDLNMLIYAFQVPAVLLGMANIPEGLAKVQMEAFQRRIQSIQAELEKVVEGQIFRRVLRANGFGDEIHVEFEWGTPSIMETEGRMQVISEMVKSPTTSMAMKAILEDELITMLKLDKDEWEQLKLEMEKKEEEERKRLEAQPQPRVPGQNKSFPQAPKPKPKITQDAEIKLKELDAKLKTLETNKEVFVRKSNLIPIKKVNVRKDSKEIKAKHKYNEGSCAHCTESWDSIVNLKEWLGFNYKDYLAHILAATEAYQFDFLKGITQEELAAGYLTTAQIGSLRSVLKNGFKKGESMTTMAKKVKAKVSPKDLYRMTEDGQVKIGAAGFPVLSRSADARPIGIVRSEVTRLANMGAVEEYKANGIKQVEWVASFGNRTCPECEELNGKVFSINEYPEIPLHPMCRCTLTPITALN